MAASTGVVYVRAEKSNITTVGHPGLPEPHTWLQDFALVIEVVMPVLACVVIGLRAYIRVVTKNLGWDDYWIFGATLLCTGQAVMSVMYIEAEYIGIHDKDIPLHDKNYPILLNYIAGLIYNPILSMVKISVLVFLLRLASTKPAAKVTIWVLMTFTFGLMVAIFFSVVFVCQPVSYNWNPKIKEGKCFPKGPFAMWTSSITIFTDLLVLALPFWIFLGLRMARKAKIALLSVFALGIIVTIIGGVRLFFIHRGNFKPKSPDSHFSIGYTTTAFETNLAVIAASGPALWPLARRWFPGFFSNLGLSRGYQGDIPDIETNSGSNDTKDTIAANSLRNSPFITRILGKSRHTSRSGGSSRDRNQIKKKISNASSGNVGFGVHTNHSIGGTHFALRDMRGDKAKGRTEIRSRTPADSEEELMTYNGVMLTTDYNVSMEPDQRKTSGATERSWWDNHRCGRGANRESVGSLGFGDLGSGIH